MIDPEDIDPDNLTGKYILIDRIAVPCHSLMQWGKWFATADRHVGDTQVGRFRVSTVFLGLDHSFGRGKPVLFETMVFGPLQPGHDTICERYRTWGEAARGHAAIVAQVKEINTQISRLKDSPATEPVQQPTQTEEPAQEPAATASPKPPQR